MGLLPKLFVVFILITVQSNCMENVLPDPSPLKKAWPYLSVESKLTLFKKMATSLSLACFWNVQLTHAEQVVFMNGLSKVDQEALHGLLIQSSIKLVGMENSVDCAIELESLDLVTSLENPICYDLRHIFSGGAYND